MSSSSSPSHPIHLILDWDSTLTTTSTLPLIARISSSPSISSTWSTVSSSYTSDYLAHTTTYTPTAPLRTTIPLELHFLSSLRPIERASTERAEAAGLFKGVSKGDVRAAGARAVRRGEVVMREGWADVVGAVVMGGGKVGVVSVGWSGEFIRACLGVAWEEAVEAIRGEGRFMDVDVDSDAIDVRANEIVGEQSGKMSRYFEEEGMGGDGGIWTVGDKRKVMDETTNTSADASIFTTVHVGDSTTDLECLLSADVGICIRSWPEMTDEQVELERTLTRLGIDCHDIDSMSADQLRGFSRRDKPLENKALWWMSDFYQLCQSPVIASTRSDKNNDQNMWSIPEKTTAATGMSSSQSLQDLPAELIHAPLTLQP